jgi:hypothetical protein
MRPGQSLDTHRGAGFRDGSTRQRRDDVPAGLGLPKRVDYRAPAVADDLVEPQPRLGVDGLANGAENPQRRPRVPEKESKKSTVSRTTVHRHEFGHTVPLHESQPWTMETKMVDYPYRVIF